MPTRSFDLAAHVSRLLASIELGRKRMMVATQQAKLKDQAQCEYSAAITDWQTFTETHPYDKAGLDHHKSVAEKAKQRLDDRTRRYEETTAFIPTLVADIQELIQRIPLNPLFAGYRSAISELRSAEPGAWQDPPSIPDLDTLEFRLREMLKLVKTEDPKKPVSRHPRYKVIDSALQEIAESRPRDQAEVFHELEKRRVPIPGAEPFQSARGWIAGFQKRGERARAAARAWLSKRWTELGLPPLPRGPKNPKK
jgi:hypothetical protein